jgi:23S rRNA (adenine2503-C2)-methyltransferase
MNDLLFDIPGLAPSPPPAPELPTADPRTLLKGMSVAELEAWVKAALGEPGYRARQLFRWLYGRQAEDFEAMTDLSRELRGRLAELARVDALELREVFEADDGTTKLIFHVPRTGGTLESVWIPTDDRVTLCVSSQVGCALGCEFCLTAKMGLRGHLTAGEIVDQVVWAKRLFDARQRLTNVVFMGMGEPLHNYDNVVAAARLMQDDRGLNLSQRRITVSTVGLVPAIERLGADQVPVQLAVSLNATTDEVRDRIMPVNRRYPIATLIGALRRFPLPNRARITIEYVLLEGVNDTVADAERLARLLRGLRCKINLIPWNPHEGAGFKRPGPERVARFQAVLQHHNYNCLVRETRGDEKMAACGQLGGGTSGSIAPRERRRREPPAP